MSANLNNCLTFESVDGLQFVFEFLESPSDLMFMKSQITVTIEQIVNSINNFRHFILNSIVFQLFFKSLQTYGT